MCIVINLLLCTNKSSLLRKARKEIKMEKTKVYSRTEMREQAKSATRCLWSYPVNMKLSEWSLRVTLLSTESVFPKSVK